MKDGATTATDNETFVQACRHWDAGDLKRAFRLFRSLAAGGDSGAQLNLGYFFDQGLGVRRDEAKALYWYRRSYASGDASGANNIAIIYRDRGDAKRAIAWLRKAITAGDDGAALELAKIHLRDGSVAQAKRYLERVSISDRATESENEEAKALLKRMYLTNSRKRAAPNSAATKGMRRVAASKWSK